MPSCARSISPAQPRARKTIPVTARLAPGTVTQLEAMAHRLGLSHHRVLKTAVEYGLSPAITALTAQAAEISQ